MHARTHACMHAHLPPSIRYKAALSTTACMHTCMHACMYACMHMPTCRPASDAKLPKERRVYTQRVHIVLRIRPPRPHTRTAWRHARLRHARPRHSRLRHSRLRHSRLRHSRLRHSSRRACVLCLLLVLPLIISPSPCLCLRLQLAKGRLVVRAHRHLVRG